MKSSKIIIVVIGLLTLVCLVIILVNLVSEPKILLTTPNPINILSIEFSRKNEANSTIENDKDNISEIIKFLNESERKKVHESLKDAPYKAEYMKMVLRDKENIETVLYIYEENGKYYIEQPYIGIYKITETEYNNIITRG